ncbi:hypothetical protein DWB64_17455 [Fusibacter sp. A1]|nr:hypothetical protein DWB64_17455 [Fusibacter sp. A1]
MKRNHRQQGSTSVLVIILMVVLIVLGLAIFTTSLSSLRLTNKKTQWIQSYYALEKDSSHTLAAIDQLVSDIYSAKENQAELTTAVESLLDLQPGELVITNESPEKYDFELTFNINSKDDPQQKHILITLGVYSPSGTAQKPFDIVVYEQWQEDFEFYNLPGFEDPLTTPIEFNLPETEEDK